jgi:Ca2+-binding EF-hand superfamily protein
MMGGPLMAALDANHDGVIDEKEIANASAALKTLDKNGDGKLTRDELFPQRQGGQGGPRGGAQGGTNPPAAK